jgi:hypothetical protein
MKVLVEDYKFDKDAKQVTFTGNLVPDSLEKILLITNVTSGDIIYNFADKLRGGNLSGNILTLIYDTSKMSNLDRLQIFIDSDQHQDDVIMMLANLLKTVNFARDYNDRIRIIMDNSPMLYTYMRNSGSSLNGSSEGWYSAGAWNTVDAREQLMEISNTALIQGMQRWVRQ